MTYDGTNLEEIRAQARQGRIFACVWTWKQHEIFKTKREATAFMRDWVDHHRDTGWTVTSRGEYGYVAVSGETRAAIALHEYNAETLARVFKPPRPKPVAA